MAIIKCKGTVLAVNVAGTAAPIAQVISLDLPESVPETFEADTLDNSSTGIPKKGTGRVDNGKFSAELFLDYTLLTAITGKLSAIPLPSATQPRVGVTFPGGSGMNFYVAGALSIGGASVQLKDGLKGKIGGEVDGDVTFASYS